jgi:hypothetical protein
MPHLNEFAHHKILGRFVESQQVQDLLASCKKPDFPEDARADGQQIPRRNWQPRYVLAIDGSHQEIAYERGFPGAEIGFISLASVLIDVELLQSESGKPTIDPIAFNKVEATNTFTAALPSANMIREGFPDARASFRASWYDLLAKARPAANSETLLETYQALLRQKSRASKVACPLKDLCPDSAKPSPNFPAGQCHCGKYSVYDTDALDIH